MTTPDRDSEVRDSRATIESDEDVVGLDISMHEPCGVRGGEPACSLRDHAKELGFRALHRPFAQRAPSQVLHHEIARLAVATDLVHGDDVRMIQASERFRFANEALVIIGLVQQLDRDLPVERAIEREVHAAHATATERPANLVVAEQAPGCDRRAACNTGFCMVSTRDRNHFATDIAALEMGEHVRGGGITGGDSSGCFVVETPVDHADNTTRSIEDRNDHSFTRFAIAGRSVYPQVRTGDLTLAAQLGARTPDVRYATDLFIVAAAAAGDREAMTVIDTHLSGVAPALRGVVPDHEITELVQELRVKLVTGALAGFTGKGPLRAWLRVILLRSGIDRRRRAQKETLTDEIAWLADDAAIDPATRMLRITAGPKIRGAFEHALSRLEARDRLILRQHLVDGLGAPEIATIHGVHRVTAFRWIATIRHQILTEVRETLRAELAVDAATLESLMREMRSAAMPTMERLLITAD